MARVPYSGVNQVDPTNQQTGQLQEQRIGGISADAFGGGRSDGVGDALAGLGQQMQQSAWEWEKRQRDVLRTSAAVEWTNFQAANDAAIMKMEQNAPANGIGHSAAVGSAITPELDKWLSAQPRWLQEEYAVPATRYFATRFNKSIEYEKLRGEQFAEINIQKLSVEKANRANTNPAEADAAIQEFDNFVKGTPLNATQQMAATHAGTVTIRAAQLKAEARNSPWLTQKGGAEQLRARESSGDYTIVNNDGFAGAYQFGAPRLADLGVFKPAASLEGWNTRPGKTAKWEGTWNIPNHPEVRTLGDFLSNKAAQDEVYALHVQRMDATIDARGWDKLIGTEVRGIPITREGLRYGMHLGGPGGVEAFLRGETRQDSNGTKVAEYIAMGRYGEGTIADDPKYQVLAPDQRDALVRDGEREFIQRRNEEAAEQQAVDTQRFNNLWKDINDGKAGAAELFDARESWLTEPSQIAQLENLLAQSSKRTVDLAEVNRRLDPNSGYMWSGTSEDTKALNLKYEDLGGNAAVGQMNQKWMDQYVHGEGGFVRQTGFVPDHLVKQLETMARQPDPARMTWAYQQLDRIQAEIPGALPTDVSDKVLDWRHRLQWLDTEQMQKAIVDDKNPSVIAARKQAVDAAFNGQDAPIKEVDAAEVIGEITGAGWLASGAGIDPYRDVPQQVLWEFSGDLQTGVRTFMEAGHSFDQALAATKEKMARSWGISPVGRNGLMKNPPQKSYLAVEGNYDYMDFQARQKIAEHGVSKNLVNETEFSFFNLGARVLAGGALTEATAAAGIGEVSPINVPVERPYVLVGDGRTQSEVDAKVLPSYDLMYLNDQKVWTSAGRIQFNPQQYMDAAMRDPIFRARADALAKRKQRALGPIE